MAKRNSAHTSLSLLSQLQAQKLRLAYTRSSHYGGSLPNVNQIGCGLAEFQVSGHQPRSVGSQATPPADSPVLFGRAPSIHLWTHLGALGTMGWWNGYSETPEEWCPHFADTPATYPSQMISVQRNERKGLFAWFHLCSVLLLSLLEK